MDSTALVKERIDWGQDVQNALDEARFPYSGALWFADPDRQTWHLVIVTPRATTGAMNASIEIGQILRHADLYRQGRDDLPMAISPADLRIQLMTKKFRQLGLQPPTRWYEDAVDGTMVDEAYVYKLAV